MLAYLFGKRRAVLGLLDVNVFHLGLELDDLELERIEQLAQVRLILVGEALALFFEDLVGQALELV